MRQRRGPWRTYGRSGTSEDAGRAPGSPDARGKTRKGELSRRSPVISLIRPDFSGIWDPLGQAFHAWGLERCLWGTDWTRAFALVNYEQAVEPFRRTDRLSDSERAMLMGGACAEAYGWSPKKA